MKPNRWAIYDNPFKPIITVHLRRTEQTYNNSTKPVQSTMRTLKRSNKEINNLLILAAQQNRALNDLVARCPDPAKTGRHARSLSASARRQP